MNPFEFVLAIIVITAIFSLLRHRMGARQRWHGPPVEDSAETLRLRDEVKELNERIKVLERITVDKENSVARQIEELRDR
jgi:hypothetical protein